MTWHFHSQNILKNNLSWLPVLSTSCVVHCWLQRQLGRLHGNERFGRYYPKGKTNKYLSFFLFINTYQLRTSETRRILSSAWKSGSLEWQVQGAVSRVERAIAQWVQWLQTVSSMSVWLHLKSPWDFLCSKISLHPTSLTPLCLHQGSELIRLSPSLG